MLAGRSNSPLRTGWFSIISTPASARRSERGAWRHGGPRNRFLRWRPIAAYGRPIAEERNHRLPQEADGYETSAGPAHALWPQPPVSAAGAGRVDDRAPRSARR